jgi:small GTP-binding protein
MLNKNCVYEEINIADPNMIDEMKYNKYSIKCVIIGDSATGKTSIINTYQSKNIKNNESTLGATYWDLNFKFDNSIIKINFWDTAGQERYNSLIPMYIRDCDIIILTFDITNRHSFNNLEKWRKFIMKNYDCPEIIIVGNKSDLNLFINVEQKEIDDYIHNNFTKKTRFFRTSALKNININNLFDHIFDISKDIIKHKNIKPEIKFNTIENSNKCCNIL